MPGKLGGDRKKGLIPRIEVNLGGKKQIRFQEHARKKVRGTGG